MQAEARVNEIRATIERKTIRRPSVVFLAFGRSTLAVPERGQAVVPLQSRHPVYVDFSVPQQEIPSVHIGNPLAVKVDGVSVWPPEARSRPSTR